MIYIETFIIIWLTEAYLYVNVEKKENTIMRNTIVRVPYTTDINQVKERVVEILNNNKFYKNEAEGENVFTKGNGFLFTKKCINIVYTDTEIVLSGWVYLYGMGHYGTRDGDLTAPQAILQKSYITKVFKIIENSIQ